MWSGTKLNMLITLHHRETHEEMKNIGHVSCMFFMVTIKGGQYGKDYGDRRHRGGRIGISGLDVLRKDGKAIVSPRPYSCIAKQDLQCWETPTKKEKN